MRCAWIIGAAGDVLAEQLPAALSDRDWRVRRVEAGRLCDLSVTLSGKDFLVEGEPAAAVVFRSATNDHFSSSFGESEQSFVDGEVRALWLAATSLPAVACFNRLDAVAWFETEHWSVWRRKLAEQGVPLAPCTFGSAFQAGTRLWVPFSAPVAVADPGETVARAAGCARFAEQTFTRTVVACGQVVSGPGGNRMEAVMSALTACGVSLAVIRSDGNGDVAWVDTSLRDLTRAEAAIMAAAMARHLAAGVEVHA